jgi:thiol-disulfide isomerase/thioredoxin
MTINFFKCSLLFLIFQIGLKAYAQELTIVEQDFEQAKKQSITQGKLLIIDFYTDWCIPCRELDAAVFRDSTMSRQLAKNFVVLRYNAEKRDTVYKLALKYHVGMYPTTLVLNLQQRILHQAYGMLPGKKGITGNYLDFLADAIKNSTAGKIINGVSAPGKTIYPKFYEDYVFRTNTKGLDEKLAAYWNSTEDYLSEVPFSVLCYFSGGTQQVNDFFLKHKQKYAALYGELDVKFILSMMVGKKMNDAMKAVNRKAFEEGIAFAREHLSPQEALSYIPLMEERMLQLENRWEEALKMFSLRKKQQGLDDNASLRFSSAVAEKCSDTSVLNICKEWMEKIALSHPNHDNLSVYARLVYKTGNKAQGLKLMGKAISTGKLSNQDVSESEEWLKASR